MTVDPEDQSEALDEDTINPVADYSGDAFGEGLPDYPPDRPVGVDAVGVTPLEQAVGESFADRSAHEEPEAYAAEEHREERGPAVGQTVEPHASTDDDEEQAVADQLPGHEPGPEAGAMRIVDDDA